MPVGPKGRSLAESMARASVERGGKTHTEEDGQMAVLDIAGEASESPAVGKDQLLRHGPLVEGTLTLLRADGTYAELGIHYTELPQGGYTNLGLTSGERLTADYFYHADEAAVTITSVIEGATSQVRYATMLKTGL